MNYGQGLWDHKGNGSSVRSANSGIQVLVNRFDQTCQSCTTCGKIVFICVLVYRATEMVLCTICFALGVGVAASNTMRTSPLSGILDQTTLVLLSISLGRFLFTVVHIPCLFCRPEVELKQWANFRSVYVIASIIILLVVTLTGSNLVTASIVLLLELVYAVEETSRAVDQVTTADAQPRPTIRDRLERVLTTIGFLLVVPHIILPSILSAIAVIELQSPSVLGPLDVGQLCFTVVFYTLTGVILVSSKRRRGRLAVPQRSLKVPVDSTTSQNVVARRRPIVGAISIDGKRRRVLKRPGAEFLLHAVRGRRVCSSDVNNAIKVAAASARVLTKNIINHRQLTSSSA